MLLNYSMNLLVTIGDLLGEGTISESSVQDMILTLSLSVVLGIIIFFVYKYSYQGVVYSHNFNTTLLGMTVITSVIIRTITSNILLSLGLVGALSIVRFRTAIKDPKDVLFLYYSISVGIAVGAGIYLLAVISTIFIGVVLYLTSKVKSTKQTYLLILKYNVDSTDIVNEKLTSFKHSVKNKLYFEDSIEMTIELFRKQNSNFELFLLQLKSIPLMEYVNLVKFNGDYADWWILTYSNKTFSLEI